MAINDLEQRFRVFDRHGVNPGTADLDRLVVHAHQGRPVARAQRVLQAVELFLFEASSLLAGDHRVEHDEAPAAMVPDTVRKDPLGAQMSAHQLRRIVVAGQAESRNAETGKDPADARISLRAGVMHQVAGGEQQVQWPVVVAKVSDDAFEGVQGIHSQQVAAGARIQMGVGQLQDTQGAWRKIGFTEVGVRHSAGITRRHRCAGPNRVSMP